MTDMQKNNIKQLTGSIIASIIVFMVGFSVTSSREDSKELKHIIDSKVDKVDFQQKCEETDQRITTLETKQAEILQKNTETLQEIVKQNATMQTDIAWIKREIDRKTKN